jgi:hypothetical protein
MYLRLLSSGMWHFVVWYIFAHIVEEDASHSSALLVEAAYSPENWYLPNTMVSHPRRCKHHSHQHQNLISHIYSPFWEQTSARWPQLRTELVISRQVTPATHLTWWVVCIDGMIIGREKPKQLERNLPQYHFVHYTSHIDCSGIQPGPRQ